MTPSCRTRSKPDKHFGRWCVARAVLEADVCMDARGVFVAFNANIESKPWGTEPVG
jgi:hypothetical protein